MDLNPFLCREHDFKPFTIDHILPLLIIAVIAIIYIYKARKLDDEQTKIKRLFYISLIPFFGAFMLYPMAILDGDINIYEDLPLHLCRFLSLSSPFFILKNNRFWIGIFYFWISVGTLNANITPDVEYGFPNWSYFSYWIMHGFLMIIPFYYIIVLKLRIKWRDYFNAYWMMNVFLLFTLGVNFILGSNYMYTRAKPDVGSLLDILGPWPVYLISGQILVLVLFYLAFMPFHVIGIVKPSLLGSSAHLNPEMGQ